MEVVYPCCCGLDVHKKSITACVLWAGGKGKCRKGAPLILASFESRFCKSFRMITYAKQGEGAGIRTGDRQSMKTRSFIRHASEFCGP
jgi:hypothetical protein